MERTITPSKNVPLKISVTGGPKNAMWMKKYEKATATIDNPIRAIPVTLRGGAIDSAMRPIFMKMDRAPFDMPIRPNRLLD